MVSNGAHAAGRLFAASFRIPLAMSDGFAIPSESYDLPPAETNRLYDYDLYGSPSDAAAHTMEVDDTSNGSTDPVLPLDTQ